MAKHPSLCSSPGAPPGDPRCLEAWLRLALTPGLGPKGYALLCAALRAEGLAVEQFVALKASARTALWRERGAGALTPNLDIPPASKVKPLARRLAGAGVQWAGAEADRFPQRLSDDREAEPPPVLFWRGDASWLDTMPTVGIAGLTSPSAFGRHGACDLAGRLAADGWLVVSGLARGIDRAAHLGAIEGGGRTAAFLPQGILDVELPEPLAEALEQGRFLLLSPWSPTARWASPLAVRRNALIAAASDGLIAAEMSPRGGGTGHTVAQARRRDIPVWTLVRPNRPKGSGGNRWLLETGARPIRLNQDGSAPRGEVESLKAGLEEARLRRGRDGSGRQLELPI
jgi:DNA processing protein